MIAATLAHDALVFIFGGLTTAVAWRTLDAIDRHDREHNPWRKDRER